MILSDTFIREAVIIGPSYYYMVYQGYVKQRCCLFQQGSLPFVLFSRIGISGGVIVDNDNAACQFLHSFFDYHLRVHYRAADAPDAQPLFCQNFVGSVKI